MACLQWGIAGVYLSAIKLALELRDRGRQRDLRSGVCRNMQRATNCLQL